MKNMKITPSKLFATATVASLSNAAFTPFADVFEALASPVDKVTRETLAQ